ncbi:MAG: sodium:solute symporter family protein [Pirellulales bacterium]
MTALVILGIYLGLLVLIGALAGRLSRGTSADFQLASHSIGPVLLLMSLFGTTMTAFALVGSTAEAYRRGSAVYGLLAAGSGIVHSACFYFIGTRLWAWSRQHGYRTQIEFFRDRLQSRLVAAVLFPVLVGLVVPYLLVGVLGGGEVASQVTAGAFAPSGTFPGWFAASNHGLPRPLASAVICLVVLAYVFIGGMRGTTWANALQTLIFITLGLVTFLVVARGVGGGDSLWASLVTASAAVPPDKLGTAGVPKLVWFGYLLVPLSVGMFPHVFQHWLTAKTAASFKLPIVGQPLCIAAVWAPCVLIGLWATTPAAGLPTGVRDNEILGLMVARHAGPVLSGLLAAGVLAAVMSSLDSQFLCLGTLFARDLVPGLTASGRLSERAAVRLSRGFIVAVVVATWLLSLVTPTGVFSLGVWCFSGFAALFPLVAAAVFWQRLSAPAAVAAIVTTAATWAGLFWHSGFGTAKGYAFPPLPGSDAALGLGLMGGLGHVLPPLPPVVLLVGLSTIVLVGVSLVTRPPDEATLERFFPRDGRGPWSCPNGGRQRWRP